jgi:hypothetical protein
MHREGSHALYVIPGRHRGMVGIGNLNLNDRPIVRNPDGSISTVRTISIGVGGRELLIPTVVNGRVVSNNAAIQHYRRTGENLGAFRSPAAADLYSLLLHRMQARAYGA